MSFQPFGYSFEIYSHFPPAEVKSAIRAKKKRWLDAKSGARGWIVGPVICLWNSAFDRYGPMIVGMIESDGFGTRLRGRAGSDLNGIVMLTLLVPFLCFVLYKGVLQDGGEFLGLVWPVVFVVLLVPFAYWSAHSDRREADVLVRFLRDVMEPQRKGQVRARGAVEFSKNLCLAVNGDKEDTPATSQALDASLGRLECDGFLILERADEDYMQTLCLGEYFKIEWRDGDRSKHYRAEREVGGAAGGQQLDNLFTPDEVFEVLCAYGAGASAPSYVKWMPLYS